MKKTFLLISFFSALNAQADELRAKDPQLQAIYDHQKTLIKDQDAKEQRLNLLRKALFQICSERAGNYESPAQENFCKHLESTIESASRALIAAILVKNCLHFKDEDSKKSCSQLIEQFDQIKK